PTPTRAPVSRWCCPFPELQENPQVRRALSCATASPPNEPDGGPPMTATTTTRTSLPPRRAGVHHHVAARTAGAALALGVAYSDDKGNWTETLGIVSVVVEVGLLILAGFVLASSRRVER